MSAIDISSLSKEDKLLLLDELWAEMERDPTQLKLSKEQQQELDRRLDALEQEGPSGLNWSDVLALARKQAQ